MTVLRIDVTQDCIDAADYLRENEPSLFPRSECCPVALALKSQGFPEGAAWINGWVFDGAKAHNISGLLERTNIWDQLQSMEPFSFELPG